ncbi:peptidoglycan-binding-domain containing protein [Thermus phage MN1]|nr:peptidoglycan-binding-domain containing protein [Thermus phage MN1]
MRAPKPGMRDKALRLVASYEGGWDALAGNFDGQVLSWGPLQFNLGQGSLYYVLRNIPSSVLERHLGREFVEALRGGIHALRNFVLQYVVRGADVLPDWRRRFRALAQTPEAKEAFLKGAEPYFYRAERLLQATEWETERGYVIAFDTAVQNGAPRRDHLAEYEKRLRDAGNPGEEWKRLKIWAYVVADLANPRWREDVLSRKLTIAVGRGVVHGRYYDLERDFDISYRRRWYEEA